jgi:phenylpropionate dioxygenase-like ring-hydroxylating dioxygenase large terminal subunit
VIFASFDPEVAPLEAYLGATMVEYFDRVFDGRALRVLGYSRQLIPSNWKLMFENIKDPYHASLLHVFLVSFGLFRADQPSAVKMDETGRHACLISRRGEQKKTERKPRPPPRSATCAPTLPCRTPGCWIPCGSFRATRPWSCRPSGPTW